MDNFKIIQLIFIVGIMSLNLTADILLKTDLDKNLEKRAVDTSNDLIVFEDGDKSIVEIVDTSGCKIKMIRKGVKGSIDKAFIDYIVFNNDTVNYKNFKCLKVSKKVMKVTETREYKLYHNIAKMPSSSTAKFEMDINAAILNEPIKGKWSKKTSNLYSEKIRNVFNDKLKLFDISKGYLIDNFNNDSVKFDLLFLPLSSTEFLNSDNIVIPIVERDIVTRRAVSRADFILLDIRKKEILLRDTLMIESGEVETGRNKSKLANSDSVSVRVNGKQVKVEWREYHFNENWKEVLDSLEFIYKKRLE